MLDATEGEYVLTFWGKRIDLAPFYFGFPYENFAMDFQSGKLFFIRNSPEGDFLHATMLDQRKDVTDAKQISTIDLGKRTFGSPKYNSYLGGILVESDERNDEVTNIWFYPEAGGAPQKLTHVNYVYGFVQTPSRKAVYYISRHDKNPKDYACLGRLDLVTKKTKRLFCDREQSTKFYWTLPSISPDGVRVAFPMIEEDDRNKHVVVVYDVRTDKWRKLPKDRIKMTSSFTPRSWLDKNRLVYATDEEGFTNAYVYDFRSEKKKQLTAYKENVRSLAILSYQGKKFVMATVQRDLGTRLVLLDPNTGQELYQRNMDGDVLVQHEEKEHVIVVMQSPSAPREYRKVQIDPSKDGLAVKLEPFLSWPDVIKSSVVQCQVEKVSYKSWDRNPKPPVSA